MSASMAATAAPRRGRRHNRRRSPESVTSRRHRCSGSTSRQRAEDRALFSKQNHGEPAIAATPRPGVFQGAGVSHGSHTPIVARPNGEERPGAAANRPMAGQKPAPTEPPREAHHGQMLRRLKNSEGPPRSRRGLKNLAGRLKSHRGLKNSAGPFRSRRGRTR